MRYFTKVRFQLATQHIGELQNPLPLKIMLCKGDMNNSASRSEVFLQR